MPPPAPPPPPPRAPRARPRGAARAAAGLALLCAAVELVLLAGERGWVGAGAGGRWWRSLALGLGGFWPALARGAPPAWSGQPGAMFLTYALLHAGPGHMLGNAVALAWLGRRLDRAAGGRTGAGAVLGCFAVSAVAGAAAFALLGDGVRPMVGASASVYGMVGLWLVMDAPRSRLRRGGPGDWTGAWARRLLPAVALLAALELVGALGLGVEVAWQAHGGGLLAGLALGGLLRLAAR